MDNIRFLFVSVIDCCALAFLGATTPPGVVAFLWAFFCLIADKAGIEALSKFAESDDTTLIVFLVGGGR